MKLLIFSSLILSSVLASACPVINANYEACVPAENEEETLMPIAVQTEVINGTYVYSIDTLSPIGMKSSMPTTKMIADEQWRTEAKNYKGDVVQSRVSCRDNQVLRHEQVLDGETKQVKSNTVTVYSRQGKLTLLFKVLAAGPDLTKDVLYAQSDVFCVKK